MSDNNPCPHFGWAVPDDFDCSGCTVAEECYAEWQRLYKEIAEEELAGKITHAKANERFAKLGCEVPDNVL